MTSFFLQIVAFGKEENEYFWKEQKRLKRSDIYVKKLRKQSEQGDSRGTYLLSKQLETRKQYEGKLNYSLNFGELHSHTILNSSCNCDARAYLMMKLLKQISWFDIKKCNTKYSSPFLNLSPCLCKKSIYINAIPQNNAVFC